MLTRPPTTGADTTATPPPPDWLKALALIVLGGLFLLDALVDGFDPPPYAYGAYVATIVVGDRITAGVVGKR